MRPTSRVSYRGKCRTDKKHDWRKSKPFCIAMAEELSKDSVHRILIENLLKQKVCSVSIPHSFKEEQRRSSGMCRYHQNADWKQVKRRPLTTMGNWRWNLDAFRFVSLQKREQGLAEERWTASPKLTNEQESASSRCIHRRQENFSRNCETERDSDFWILHHLYSPNGRQMAHSPIITDQIEWNFFWQHVMLVRTALPQQLISAKHVELPHTQN